MLCRSSDISENTFVTEPSHKTLSYTLYYVRPSVRQMLVLNSRTKYKSSNFDIKILTRKRYGRPLALYRRRTVDNMDAKLWFSSGRSGMCLNDSITLLDEPRPIKPPLWYRNLALISYASRVWYKNLEHISYAGRVLPMSSPNTKICVMVRFYWQLFSLAVWPAPNEFGTHSDWTSLLYPTVLKL